MNWFHHEMWRTFFIIKERISDSFFILHNKILMLWVHPHRKLGSSRLVEERLCLTWSSSTHLLLIQCFHSWIYSKKVTSMQKCPLVINLHISCIEGSLVIFHLHHKICIKSYWVQLIWVISMLLTVYSCLVWFPASSWTSWLWKKWDATPNLGLRGDLYSFKLLK